MTLTGAFCFVKQLQHLRPHLERILKPGHKQSCSCFWFRTPPQEFFKAAALNQADSRNCDFLHPGEFSSTYALPVGEMVCGDSFNSHHRILTKDTYASYSVRLQAHNGEPYKQLLPSGCLGWGLVDIAVRQMQKLLNFLMFYTFFGNLKQSWSLQQWHTISHVTVRAASKGAWMHA